ncbi:MAG: hypothetical protein ABIW32_09670 [Terrimesophilobacter sp.]
MFDPEHLSFSGTLQRSDGSVMIVRVVSSARTATVWKHSFAGSPRPAETVLAAVRRSAERDLGIHAFSITPLLPTLSNHTLSAGGTV